MNELYKLGEELRKERTELAELFAKSTTDPAFGAEKVEELRRREAALAEKQAKFDVLFEADRMERENKAHLDRIGQVRRPVEPEGPGEAKDAQRSRPFGEIAAGVKELAAKAASAKTPVEHEFADLSGDESVRLMPQLKTLFQLSSAPQEDERLTRIAFMATEERSIIDLPAPGTVSNNTYSYLEETTLTNNAVETAEGSNLGENAFAFTERTGTVRWIGAWLPVTEIALDDIAFLESYLRGRMGFTVRQRLASQLLNGDNVGQNLNGYYTAVTQAQAKGSDPVFDAIYKGMKTVRNTGFAEPDAIVFNPNDWADLRLTRTIDGIYILGNPADRGAETVFGLPIVQTTHAVENTALVGAFREHSQFFVRQGVALAVTNSHASDFIAGKIAIRATMRGALTVYRPSAFVKVTGI